MGIEIPVTELGSCNDVQLLMITKIYKAMHIVLHRYNIYMQYIVYAIISPDRLYVDKHTRLLPYFVAMNMVNFYL